MKKILIIFLVFSACAESNESVAVDDNTADITATSSTITTIISDTAPTNDKSTSKNKSKRINPKFIFDEDSLPDLKWSEEFKLYETDEKCIDNSSFNSDSDISGNAIINLEKDDIS